jgi:hypothetical protein
MLPQHGGVPNLSMRIKGPFIAALAVVLLIGLMTTLMFHLEAQTGDVGAKTLMKQSLMATIFLSCLILISATWRWWQPHLWKHGNSQTHHRKRTKKMRDEKKKQEEKRHHRHRSRR